MNDVADQEQSRATPYFRVFTCGPFRIEQWQQDTSWQAIPKQVWGRNHPPRLLLKLLLCQPQRSAARPLLLKALWPDYLPKEAHSLLTNTASVLRSALKPAEAEASLLLDTEDHSRYGLAGQDLLWVDADAALAVLQEAEALEQAGGDPLPLLEEAAALLKRGMFLEGEEHALVRGRRATVARAWRGCRLWQARILQQREQWSQAHPVLDGLLEEDPNDEDALCSLMQLLQARGRPSEALRLYEQLVERLDEQSKQPLETTRQVADHLRSALPPAPLSLPPHASSSLVLVPKERPSLPAVTQGIISAAQKLRGQSRNEALADQGTDLTQDTESNESVNRRKATQTLGTLGLALLTHPHLSASQVLHHEEVLSLCETNIPHCWQLYFDGQLSTVQQVLFPLLPHLAALIHEPYYQQRAAHVASKAYQLAALLEMHHQNLGNALFYAKQGALCGDLAQDSNLHIASLIQQGNIYFHLKQLGRELEIYQHAYALSQKTKKQAKGVAPLLEGRVYIGLAKSYGKFGEEQKSLQFLQMAHETYPEHPEDDPAFSYTCHTRFTLNNHTGLTYLNLGQAAVAWDIFQKLENTLPAQLVPRRMELYIRQAAVSLALGNLEESCLYLEAAVQAALTLGSDLRLNEACELYLPLTERWGHEQRVKTLGIHYFGFSA